MIIKTFTAGPIDANNYLVMDESSKEAVLIDCSEKKTEILETIKELGAKVKYILLTHGHFDHVLGVNEMKKELNAKVLVHKDDIIQMNNTSKIMVMFGLNGAENPVADGFVDDGDELTIGDTEIKVIHTPGHTEGCVCYKIEDKIFSGDTLFKASVGRTDLPGGDFKKLVNSIKNVLFKFDDNTTIFPGHGTETTIKYEKMYNEIL